MSSFARGGDYYERNVADVLKNYCHLTTWELQDKLPRFLKFSRLGYFYETWAGSPYHANLLITNKAGVFYGIKLDKFERNVLIVHHVDAYHDTHSIINRGIERYILSKLKNFDKIVTVAQYWKDFLQRYVPAEKVVVIYNSFPVQKIQSRITGFDPAEFKTKHNIPLGQRIVYAGNSLKSKGILKTKELLKNSPYHIITSGARDVDCGTQHLTLSYQDYLRLLSIADVSVLLSEFKEGWNRIAHESLLCGTPVIGRAIAGLGELLVESKQTIYRNGDDLKALIEEVGVRPEIVQRGQDVLKQFDIGYFEREWIKVVKDLFSDQTDS
jgi:glycosyltransferase involved in cell wall biosynthesis